MCARSRPCSLSHEASALFLYWILFPLIFGAVLLGLGLGLRKLTVPFAGVLLLPAGFCVAILVATYFTWWSFTPHLTGPILVILAGIGWRVGYRDLRRPGLFKGQLTWIGAGIAGFLAFGASVITSGKPTFSGYNEILDIAYQFDWAAYLGEHGRQWVDKGISSPLNVVSRTLEVGYPSGPQAILGTLPRTFGMELSWAYQPMMAMVAGCLILAAFHLLREVVPSPRFAAIGAFAVGQASTLINYAQIGGIKELTASVALLTTAAFIPHLQSGPETKNWKAALPVTVACAATFSIFSLTLVPWLALLAIGAIALLWRAQGRKIALRRGGFAIVVVTLLSLPTIVAAFKSLAYADVMQSATEVGNLAHPLSRWAATGVWITADHRYELLGTQRTVSVVIGIIVILFALLGAVTAWRRGGRGLVVLGLASMVGMTILIVKLGPWVELKGLVLASPVVLLLAVVGLASLLTVKRIKVVGWAGVIGLLAVGIYSDALRYGATQLAPYERLNELRAFGKQFRGTTNTLFPDADEHVEYQLRLANSIGPYNWSFIPSAEYAATQPGYQYTWDLDQMDQNFATMYDGIVTRHSPGLSRPARNYDLVAQGKSYDVWKKTGNPPATAHLPLSGAADATEQQKCQAFVDAVPPGGTVTIAPSPFSAVARLDPAKITAGDTVSQDITGVYFNGPGLVLGLLDPAGQTGKFDVYMSNTSNRQITLGIGAKKWKLRRDRTIAFRPALVGTIDLDGSVQPMSIASGGRTLHAGTDDSRSNGAYVGSVTIVPHNSLHPAPVTTEASVTTCPDRVDWVETP